MSTPAESPRKRALREEVRLAREGRSAIEPISDKLRDWHEAAARLRARMELLQLHDRPAAGLPEAIEALELEVATFLADWRASIQQADVTGRVADAEKSAQGVLSALAYYRFRLASLSVLPSSEKRPTGRAGLLVISRRRS